MTTSNDPTPELDTQGDKATRENSSPDTRLARIAQRAHEIYVARGGHEGRQLDDWLEAERQIDDGEAQ